MNEWILIMTLFLKGNPGEIKDTSPIIVSGFTSEVRCVAAMEKIGKKLATLAASDGTEMKMIRGECVLIEK